MISKPVLMSSQNPNRGKESEHGTNSSLDWLQPSGKHFAKHFCFQRTGILANFVLGSIANMALMPKSIDGFDAMTYK
jgi:hypothetical protein